MIAEVVGLGAGVAVALQAWTLKEIYRLAILLSRALGQQEDHERRISRLEEAMNK